MTVKFYYGDDYHDDDFDYEMTDKEYDELKSIVRQELLDSAKGETLEEKVQYLMNEHSYELKHGQTLDDVDLDDVLGDIVDIVIDDGDYNDIARDICADSAREQYEDNKEWEKGPYSYYGISESCFH